MPGWAAGAPRLAGRLHVRLAAASRAAGWYGADEAFEEHYCSFELNPAFAPALAAAGLRFAGLDAGGAVRVAELAGHPFYVGTAFLPQCAAGPAPHPLVAAFAAAAADYHTRRGDAR